MSNNYLYKNIESLIVSITNQGEIEGVISNDIASFKGIPYAAPPIGNYRWCPPQPVTPWNDIKKTIDFPSNCSQKLNSWDTDPNLQYQSEDCLYLNIWTPKLNYDQSIKKSDYPVMIWIHGGGFVSGGSSQQIYHGDILAQQGVVVVSLNYRLGRFGFFSHPSLNSAYSSNFGLLDQIAALKWIKENISFFGGDATNITIFGESAGGAAIFSLMTIKEVQGLFHKAIIQSGTGHFRSFPPNTQKQAEEIDIQFAQQHQINGLDIHAFNKLTSLSSKEIVGNLNIQNLQSELFSGLTIDGILIHQTLKEAYGKGQFYPVPLMIGDNDGDGVFLSKMSMDIILEDMQLDSEIVNKIYNPTSKSSKNKILHQLMADIQFLEPTKWAIEQIVKKNIPVYRYRFSYIADVARPYTSFGAPHASEIPYVFNKLSCVYNKVITQDQEIADHMMTSWVSFAKTGSPNVRGLPKCDPVNIQPNKLLNFKNDGIFFETDPFQDRLNFIQKISLI